MRVQDPTSHASFEAAVGPLVAGCVDVASASPRRFFFEVLSHVATAPHEAERLQYFASAEGRDDLYQYNQREGTRASVCTCIHTNTIDAGRTVVEVLTVDFPSATPSLEWLLQAAPRLQARAFSIASSPRAHPGQLHLTVAVVQWTTPYKRQRQVGSIALRPLDDAQIVTMPPMHHQGLCSSWLASLAPAAPVPVWVSRGSLSLPPPSTPLVLVGPGTGVAPLRSVLHERAALAASGSPVAPSLLFFGCRSASGDCYYQHEWEGMGGVLWEGRVVVACSRDGPSKVYVQDKIREHGASVWRLLEGGAHVCVCGSANKMPQVCFKFLRLMNL